MRLSSETSEFAASPPEEVPSAAKFTSLALGIWRFLCSCPLLLILLVLLINHYFNYYSANTMQDSGRLDSRYEQTAAVARPPQQGWKASADACPHAHDGNRCVRGRVLVAGYNPVRNTQTAQQEIDR